MKCAFFSKLVAAGTLCFAASIAWGASCANHWSGTGSQQGGFVIQNGTSGEIAYQFLNNSSVLNSGSSADGSVFITGQAVNGFANANEVCIWKGGEIEGPAYCCDSFTTLYNSGIVIN